MKRFQLAMSLAVVLSVSCRDREPLQPSDTGGPMAVIMDGAHLGNPFFFFLPPLVPNPSSFIHPGKFNARLSPVVEVCELTKDPLDVTPPLADCIGGDPTFGPAPMALDAGNEQYQLNWDTKASPLSPTTFYRIIVRGAPGGIPLGFIDVDPVDQGMKNVRTGDVVAFQDGRTLPIKVRVEDGAFGSTNADDHVEQVVSDDIPTGTVDVTTNSGFAGARFSDGWLPEGVDQVVVIIERIPVQNGSPETNCLRTGLEELEGCYRFRTDPVLTSPFQVSVIAGVCFEIPGAAGDPEGPPFQLHRREEARGVPVGPAFPLEDVPAPFLRCDGFGESEISMGDALRSGRLGDVASAGWNALVRGVTRLVQPSALYAIDFGAGGSTDFFSRFGWARRATMAVTAGDGVTAPAGSLTSASVHVQNEHHEPVAIAGQDVTFTITGGGGTLVSEPDVTTLTVPTNSDGNATVSWRLGEGENNLSVSTAHVAVSPLTITATGTPLAALIDCGGDPGGDLLDRGFYVPEFPGTTLGRVTLHFSSATAGAYTYSLTARSGTYDGAIIGTATASATLTANDQANVATTFTFASPSVTAGSTVTFVIAQTAGPGTTFYSVPRVDDEGCPVVQTNETTPPLGTFRRQGVHVKIEGTAVAPSPLLDQQNLLDGSIGGQGIGRFNDNNGDPNPDGTSFDFQDAQTFTVGFAGQLASIKVPLMNLQGATVGVTMQIVRVADGVPDEGASLGEVTIPASAIPTDFGTRLTPSAWPTFDLTSLNIQVTAGQQLAYIVRSLSTNAYLYNPESSNGYGTGIGYRRNRALTAAWGTFGQDFGFQTFVIPSTPPTP